MSDSSNSEYGADENGDKKQSHVRKALYTKLRSLNFILPCSEHVMELMGV